MALIIYSLCQKSSLKNIEGRETYRAPQGNGSEPRIRHLALHPRQQPLQSQLLHASAIRQHER
jgi:hypothetical protein